jgi:hypothetical protein
MTYSAHPIVIWLTYGSMECNKDVCMYVQQWTNMYNLINSCGSVSPAINEGKKLDCCVITYTNAIHSYYPERKHQSLRTEFTDFVNIIKRHNNKKFGFLQVLILNEVLARPPALTGCAITLRRSSTAVCLIQLALHSCSRYTPGKTVFIESHWEITFCVLSS